ncbi:MAG: amino acid adenylation domain-containing protein [Bacteroidetes bacterium]|nr:amino acid adenylation domain-containing protein [Bacteroidota bacterium]HET6244458.1 amino acid adenylation domain-containing protein [Bacteroidia bacterium]
MIKNIDKAHFISKEYKPFLEFWQGRLKLVENGFSFGNKISTAETAVYAEQQIVLDKTTSDLLISLVKGSDTGVFVTLLTGFFSLLSRYTGEATIIVDTPIFNNINGDHFSDKISLIKQVEQEKSIKDLLIGMQQITTESYKYQNFPVAAVLGNNLEALTNVAASFTNIHPIHINETNYDLLLDIKRSGDEISIIFKYNTNVFESWFINNLSNHYQNILASFFGLNTLLKDIVLLSNTERVQLLKEFNDTSCKYPDKLIHELFEEQVLKTPDNIALICDGKQFSYRELNEKSNQLAHFIKEKFNVKADDIIGLLTDRSEGMIVSILAVLKAGGSYLPIDPAYPADRISYTLSDSGCKFVLTKQQYKNLIHNDIAVAGIEDEEIHSFPVSNPEYINKPDDLCYIIYTSGSTGNPKGVMIQHYNVVRLLFNEQNLFDFNEKDVWSLFHSYCFDFSVWEMYGALLFGGKLVIVPKQIAQNPSDFVELVRNEQVTILNQTPGSFYNFINEEINSSSKELKLRYVIFGGEALHPARLSQWRKKYPETKLVNMYGITETTVHVTYKEITKKEIDAAISNIGVPIPTLSCFVLDKFQNLQPIGVAGELCVGGKGLARGYLNRAELTREKFIDNPFVAGEKLYRSGDLAKYLPNGELEYLGRIDHQVKIRGFRIELGEIENCLQKHPSIKESVVIDRTDEKGEKYLCAYIVGSTESAINSGELREYLKQSLPDYIIPAWFIPMDNIPLTGNGKVNRKALPQPETQFTGAAYVAPRNQIEEELVKIWQEVLGIEKIGVQDNFFDLGGHSLKAAQLIAIVHKEMEVEVPFAFIFNTPVVENMAEYISSAGKTKYAAIRPAEKRAFYPLSAAQRRMYILNEFKGTGTTYNMPGVLSIEGNLNISKVENAFQQLIARQEAFRTTFEFKDDNAVQIINEDVHFKIEVEEASEDNIEDLIKDFVKPFDLSKAPLLRVKLLKIKLEKYILFFDMHHIISDGVSMEILVKEFFAFYKEEELSPLEIQYKDFAVWQDELTNTGKLEKLENYWLERFSDDLTLLDFPLDFPRPAVQKFDGAHINFQLSLELTAALKKIARETGTTLYMVLLAAYKVLLSRWANQEDIIVGTPVAGRPAPELQNIIGVFINTLALRNSVASDKSFKEFLGELKQKVLKDFEHQEYQFENLIDKLKLKRDTSRNPLFDTMFTYGEADEQQLKIDGLEINQYSFENKSSKFDITFGGAEKENQICIAIEYSTNLFKETTIKRFSNHFTNIISEIAINPAIKIKDIALLSDAEKQQVLVDFNQTAASFPTGKTVHEQIDEQAEKTPDNIALVFGEKQLSYKELKETTGNLAQVLRAKGVKRGDVVSIISSPSNELMISIFAILKAGAAYLPIDPSYPAERISYMLRDSNSKVLLTDLESEMVDDFKGVLINIKQQEIYQGNGVCKNINTVDDSAYIIYTSGSTGLPKGVVVQHKALNNLIHWHNKYHQLTEQDKGTKYAGFGFDASIIETFPYFVKGAALHILPDNLRLDLVRLNQYFEHNNITIAFLPTPVAEQFIFLENKSLRVLNIGGDKLSKWNPTPYKIINNYGPSEFTCVTSVYDVNQAYANIPIGKPVSNSRVYVLDANYKPQPIGVKGEIFASGANLAQGYLHQPELTSEKFIPDPFNPGQLMYRTGDIGRWLPDGNLEFFGRTDHQVKIRGFRIELGEIQSILQTHPYITKAVVLDRKDEEGNKFLCAYIVANQEISPADLRQYLGKQLPEYMVPAYFIELEDLPLTQNGKTDLNKLREIKLEGNIITTAEFVPPSTETEEKLVKIWQQVLKMDTIGIKDNFFELGGNSLKIVKLLKSIEDVFPGAVEISDLFDKSTIEQLAALVDSKNNTSAETEKQEIRVVDF